jgi:inward rectifier potassium channel
MKTPARKRSRANTRRATPVRSSPPDGVEAHAPRLLARETADEVLPLGLRRPWFGDLYHRTLRLGWCGFLIAASLLYVIANIVFALLFMLDRDGVANARPGAFWDAFFFSVQTMATVGYGQMYPATRYANLVVTVETAVGLMFVAIATGLVFARFSRPTARILFSRVAVIGPYNGMPTLSFRLANQRRNQILQAEVAATLLRDEETKEGSLIRRFYDLKLQRYRTPVFALTFTVMHQIDRDSPLYGIDADSLAARNAELVVTASGLDETLARQVHARTSYLPDEILWEHRFVDVLGWTEDGRRVIDYRRFHDTVSVDRPT